MAVPTRLLSELSTEAMIGGYRVLVVEGPSDMRYLQKWCSDLGWHVTAIDVTSIDSREVSFGPEAYKNNRAKVVTCARAEVVDASVRFLIDLDLGADDLTDVPGLLVTDFPSLESYALTDAVLHRLLVHLDRVEHHAIDPAGRRREVGAAIQILVEKLAGYLVPLLALRRVHATAGTLEFVEDLRRFRVSGSDELDVERIRLVLKLPEGLEIPDGLPATCTALQEWAYGHDIARSLWALWSDLRVRNGLKDSDDLERLLLSLVDPQDLRSLPLFVSLGEWAA